jgi:hypothetical protein
LLSSRKPGSKKLVAPNPAAINLVDKVINIKYSRNSVSDTTNISNTIDLLLESEDKDNSYINT